MFLCRIMAWVYLLDCYNVIFYRSPPQFKMVEAGFGLPRNDGLFDAMIPIDSGNTEAHSSPCSLNSLVQRLMDENPIQLEGVLDHIDTLFALSLILSGMYPYPNLREY